MQKPWSIGSMDILILYKNAPNVNRPGWGFQCGIALPVPSHAPCPPTPPVRPTRAPTANPLQISRIWAGSGRGVIARRSLPKQSLFGRMWVGLSVSPAHTSNQPNPTSGIVGLEAEPDEVIAAQPASQPNLSYWIHWYSYYQAHKAIIKPTKS